MFTHEKIGTKEEEKTKEKNIKLIYVWTIAVKVKKNKK